MPLEVIETADPLTSMVSLQPSATFEMIVSLHTILSWTRHRAWAEEARAALSQDFMDELKAVYGPFNDGAVFFEIAIDCPDHDDVPGFIRYMREMAPHDFVFYLLGRLLTHEQIREIGFHASNLLEAMPEGHGLLLHLDDMPLEQILGDVPAFQARLADLWERYWDEFFSGQVAAMRPLWEQGLNEKARILARDGGAALLEHVTAKKELPPELPEGYPITELVFIPTLTTPRTYLFYGYGNVTVLFDCRQSESRHEMRDRLKTEIAGTCKALSDETRMEILRLVTLKGGIHGKLIAEKVGLSASAVSRHLSILKDNGLIIEKPQDNKIEYQVNRETVDALSQRLVDYLHS